ncbi:hypothetical protein Chor_008908 [Crotalus horridus]
MVALDCRGRSAAYLGGALIALLLSGLAQPHDISRRPLWNLKMDQALLRIHNELLIDNLSIYWVSDYCYECLQQELISIQMNRTSKEAHIVAIDTQHALTLMVNHFKEGKELCSYFICISHLHGYFHYSDDWTDLHKELGSPSRTDSIGGEFPAGVWNTASSLQRLRSLDTFRGLALTIMVFVNYGGGKYWFFKHQSWNGLTIADLVFPWFVFIMGTSVSLSLSAMLRRGCSKWQLLGKVLWRSLLLFLIGLIVVNPNYCLGPSLRNRAFVLLRVSSGGAVPECFKAFFTWVQRVIEWLLPDHSSLVYSLEQTKEETSYPALQDILPYWPQWLFMLALEGLWLGLTFLLSVPGCPKGYLGPGGIGSLGKFPNCTGGAAAYIDHLLLGGKHIYQHPSSNVLYLTTVPFDPEGILGTINSVLMAFLGLQGGKILLFYKDQHKQIILRFCVWSIIMGVISMVLTKCSKEAGLIPVNKNLWSISYVTTLSSFAFILLLLIYYLIDVKKVWSGAPFFYPGEYA